MGEEGWGWAGSARGALKVQSPHSRHCGGLGAALPCGVWEGGASRLLCVRPEVWNGDSSVLPGSLIAYWCTLPSNPKAAAPRGCAGPPRTGSALLCAAQCLLVLHPHPGASPRSLCSPLSAADGSLSPGGAGRCCWLILTLGMSFCPLMLLFLIASLLGWGGRGGQELVGSGCARAGCEFPRRSVGQ